MVVRSATLRRAVISDKKKNVDKKEINSPKLTMNFLFWSCGVGGFLLFALLGLTSGSVLIHQKPIATSLTRRTIDIPMAATLLARTVR